MVLILWLVCLLPRGNDTRAPSLGFLSNASKSCSMEYFYALLAQFRLKSKTFICSLMLGKLECSRNYERTFVYFPTSYTLSRIIAGLFSVFTRAFLSILKQQVLKFSYHESLMWKFPKENSWWLKAFRRDKLTKRSVWCHWWYGWWWWKQRRRRRAKWWWWRWRWN